MHPRPRVRFLCFAGVSAVGVSAFVPPPAVGGAGAVAGLGGRAGVSSTPLSAEVWHGDGCCLRQFLVVHLFYHGPSPPAVVFRLFSPPVVLFGR